MDIFLYLLLQIINGSDWNPEFGESQNYKNWVTILDLKTCILCRSMHGKIWGITEEPETKPKIHDRCRCEIKVMVTVKAGTATTKGLNGADWSLNYESKLPNYYITREDAKKSGWNPKLGNLKNKCPDKMIFGGEYYNDNGHLPMKTDRIWYEADINYKIGFRNNQRIIYSNDGLIFVTYDHYKTFFEIV